MKPSQEAPVGRLWLGVLCGYLALGATLQELPTYMVDKYHAGSAVIGLVVGAAFLATAIVRPFAGRAGDAGRARVVVMAGGALTAVAAVAHLAAPNVAVLIAARLLMGAGEAALFSAGLPWVLAGTPSERRGRVAGWFGLSMWGGLTLGPLLAVLVNSLGGSNAVWVVVICLPLISTALAMTTGRQPQSATPAPVLPKSLREVLPAGVGLPGVILGMSAFGYGSITALLVLYLSSQHIGGQSIALSVYAISFLIARSLGSPQVDKRGGIFMAKVSLVIEAAGLLVISVGESQAWILVGAAVTGVGIGSIYPATSKLTLRRTESVSPGVAMGSMTSLWDLGILVAGPLGGVIASRAGYPASFAVAGAVTIAALGLAFTMNNRESASSQQISRTQEVDSIETVPTATSNPASHADGGMTSNRANLSAGSADATRQPIRSELRTARATTESRADD